MLGVDLVRGRVFTEVDRADAPPVMVVSRRAADELWQGGDPLTDRVEMNDQWWTVVGVVEDIRDQAPAAEPQRTVYVPFAQWPNAASRTLALRTSVPPETIADQVQRVTRELDPLLPVRDLQTMDQVMRDATAEPRFRALLVSLFGLLAAVLAAVGIFAVTAHAVVRRTREVGVHLALSATQRDVLRIILTRVATLAGAAAAGRVLRGFLFGIGATDPVTYVVISVGVLLLALAAAYIPTARAARSDPMVVLRYE